MGGIMPRRRGERAFEQAFIKAAPYYRCSFEKIADANPMVQSILHNHRKYPGLLEKLRVLLDIYKIKVESLFENRRVCDGILITPNGNYFIELKYNTGSIKPHQKESAARINNINGTYYIVRKREKIVNNIIIKQSIEIEVWRTHPKKGTPYYAHGYEANTIDEVIKWFKRKGSENGE